jgi:hypothetical protein
MDKNLIDFEMNIQMLSSDYEFPTLTPHDLIFKSG